MGREPAERVFSSDGGRDIEAFFQRQGADQRQDRVVIIDDEEPWARCLHMCRTRHTPGASDSQSEIRAHT